jgi:hypothetical protein
MERESESNKRRREERGKTDSARTRNPNSTKKVSLSLPATFYRFLLLWKGEQERDEA